MHSHSLKYGPLKFFYYQHVAASFQAFVSHGDTTDFGFFLFLFFLPQGVKVGDQTEAAWIEESFIYLLYFKIQKQN